MSDRALGLTLAAILVIAPPATRAEEENREPAAVEKAPAAKSDVKLAPAFNDAFDAINEMKTFDDFVEGLKKSLNQADRKTLAEVAAKVNKQDPNFKSKVTLSYENGQAMIRYEGKVITYKNVDFENHLVSFDGQQVDLNPKLPLKDRLDRVSAIIAKKFSSASLLNLLVPDAKAQVSVLGVAGRALLGVGALGAISALAVGGYVMFRDYWWYDYLRDVHNDMVDARDTCDRYAERKEKDETRFKWVRVNTGSYDRKGKPRFKWQKKSLEPWVKLETDKDVQAAIDKEIGNLPKPPSQDDVEGWKSYAKDVDEITNRIKEEKVTRGDLALPPEAARRTEAIRRALCDATGSGHFGGISVQNFRLPQKDEVSFREGCKEAQDLQACIDSLRDKKVLSEVGIKRLQKQLDTVRIDDDYRREQGLPGRRKEKIAQ